MVGPLEMGMWTTVWMGSCCVVASVVTALAGGREARDALGAGSWLGFGLGFCQGGGTSGAAAIAPFVIFAAVWAGVGGVGDVVGCGSGGGAFVGGVVVLGSGFGLGSGFMLRSGSRSRRTSSWRCEGTGAGWVGFLACCRGARIACVGVGGPPAA